MFAPNGLAQAFRIGEAFIGNSSIFLLFGDNISMARLQRHAARIKSHSGVLAYKYKGQRFDCGGAEGYVEATNFCFENLYKHGL